MCKIQESQINILTDLLRCTARNSYGSVVVVYAPLHKFADDLTIHQPVHVEDSEIYINGDSEIFIELKQDRNLLQLSANEVNEWCSNNNMSLSETKTKTMTLQINSKKITFEKLTINDIEIAEIESYTKILGIYIDKRLNFNKHVDFTVTKCQKLCVLKRNGLISHGLKLTYLMKIRSVLTYAALAWYNFLSTTQKD